MIDNPYRLINKTRQYQIFNIDGSNFIRVDSIQIFSSNFPNATEDITEVKLNNGDIQISELEIYGTIRMTENEMSGTALSLFTPQGTIFNTNSSLTYKTITAQVKIKGKVLSTNSKLSFYWGIESVRVSNENKYAYNQYLGRGWKCLNDYIETSDENASIEWVPASETYIFNLADATAKNNRLKVAVMYDGQILSKEINIVNNTGNVP